MRNKGIHKGTLEEALRELERISKTKAFLKLFGGAHDRIKEQLRILFDISEKKADSKYFDDYFTEPIDIDVVDKLLGGFKIKSQYLISALVAEFLAQAIDNHKELTEPQCIIAAHKFARIALIEENINTTLGCTAYLIQATAEFAQELPSLANFYRLRKNLAKDPRDFPSGKIGHYVCNITNTIKRFAHLLSIDKAAKPLPSDYQDHLNNVFCSIFHAVEKIRVIPQLKCTKKRYQEMRDLYECHEHGWKKKIVHAADAFLDELNNLESAFAEIESRIDYFDDDALPKTIEARVVDVAPSAGKSLRAAMRDPGGRPTKTEGGAKVLSQAEMAVAFGEPCNEAMVANWEARAAGKKRGANPPDAVYNGLKIIYSAELRTNPTPDNKKRLSALISEFQSRHRLKTAIDKKAKTIHCHTAESLYQAQAKHGA